MASHLPPPLKAGGGASATARTTAIIVALTLVGHASRKSLWLALVVCQNSIVALDERVGIERRWSPMSLVLALLGAARAALRTHTNLALENLALRQQLALLRHRSKRRRFGRLDRAFWVWLSRRWAGWRKALYVVRPETVIRWHRQGFRGFWTWKSRRSERVDRLSARSLRTSSAPWRTPILSGVPRAFMVSCSSSASRFRSGPLRVSCRAGRSHPRRPGERSSRTTS